MSISGPEGLNPSPTLNLEVPRYDPSLPLPDQTPAGFFDSMGPPLPLEERLRLAVEDAAEKARLEVDRIGQPDEEARRAQHGMSTGYHATVNLGDLAAKLLAETDQVFEGANSAFIESGYFKVPTADELAAHAASRPGTPEAESDYAPTSGELPVLPKRVPGGQPSPADLPNLSPLLEPLVPAASASEAEVAEESPRQLPIPKSEEITLVADGEVLPTRTQYTVLSKELLDRLTEEVLPTGGLTGAAKKRIRLHGERMRLAGDHALRPPADELVELPPAPEPEVVPGPPLVRQDHWQQLPRSFQQPIQPQVQERQPVQPPQPQPPQAPVFAPIQQQSSPGTEVVPYQGPLLPVHPPIDRLASQPSRFAWVKNLLRRARGKQS